MTGNLTWNNQSGNGLAWSNNTDKASIKFYNTGDGDTNCRLEFEIGDNNNEFFRFIMNPSGTAPNVELLKIANTEFSYKGNTIWNSGLNTKVVASKHIIDGAVTNSKLGTNSVTAVKIASGAVDSSELATDAVNNDKILDGAVTTGKINSKAVTTDKLADNSVTNDKLADVTAGFLLGKGHGQSSGSPNTVTINKTLGNSSTHKAVPSSAAVVNYVNSKNISVAAAEVNANGTTDRLSGCSVTRTSTGHYTITLNSDTGNKPIGVASLARNFGAETFTKEALNNLYYISCRRSNNTTVLVEILKLSATQGHGGGNDHNNVMMAKTTHADQDFNVIIQH